MLDYYYKRVPWIQTLKCCNLKTKTATKWPISIYCIQCVCVQQTPCNLPPGSMDWNDTRVYDIVRTGVQYKSLKLSLECNIFELWLTSNNRNQGKQNFNNLKLILNELTKGILFAQVQAIYLGRNQD